MPTMEKKEGFEVTAEEDDPEKPDERSQPGIANVILTMGMTSDYTSLMQDDGNLRRKEGPMTPAQVQEILTTYVLNGWRLFNTHYLGQSPEGVSLLYVFVR